MRPYHERPSYFRTALDNPYGATLSIRQEGIINGKQISNVQKNEISIIIKKLNKLGFPEMAMEVYERYDYFFEDQHEPPKYTIEEAKLILQSFTPFPINWGK